MAWVRENTSPDAVFAHWWDYGYWVQTMGERATVLDGGNSIPYWDYLMGGQVLTGNADNYTSGMEFLKTHKASYLLIDSTDIGKYPAYSNIGSNETFDKFSSMPTFVINEASTQEKRNETVFLFTGGFNLDEDLIWGGQIYPSGNAGIIAFFIPIDTKTGEIKQPSMILTYNDQQISAPIKCVYINGARIDFEEGIGGCLYIMPEITPNGIIKYGAGIWLSQRLMRSLMVHLYILNESKDGFILEHSEGNPIIDELNNRYNLGIPELSFNQQAGLMGPIKIWKIDYSEDIKENPAYLNITYPNRELWEIK
jgi:hypothetical protein